MKMHALFLYALVTIVYCASCKQERQFDPAEQQLIDLIASVKQFEYDSLGLAPTDNFTKFDNAINYGMLTYKKKTDMPFSLYDPDFYIYTIFDTSAASNMHLLFQKYEIDATSYDIHFYRNRETAGGTRVTQKMAQYTREELLYTIIHEDWHNNADLPFHVEEASGNLIAYVSAHLYFKQKNSLDIFLKAKLNNALRVNECYDSLLTLTQNYADSVFAYEVYMTHRSRIIKKFFPSSTDASGALFISDQHTYTYYYPLMYRLFYATGKNIQKTIAILKSIPFHDPFFAWKISKKFYFSEMREQELKIEKYLENSIENAYQDTVSVQK